MRKIALLFATIALLFSANLKGQTSYMFPYPGGQHTYTASVNDPGHKNPVRWYVATDHMGVGKAVHGTDYTFDTPGYDGGVDALVGSGVYSVDITWSTSLSVNDTFFVFIEVDDSISHCSNRMTLPITISASFNAYVVDVTGSAHPDTVNVNSPTEDVTEETCPDDVINPIWNGTGHTDIGYSDILYRVNRQLSLLDWQFEYALTEGTAQAFTIENIRMVNESGAVIYNGTAATDTISVGSTEDYVLVYIRISNQQGVTLDLNLDLLTDDDLTKDLGGNLDANHLDNNADHVILPMPTITGFGGN